MEDGKVLLPIVSNKRECGDCTKCCEGWFSGAAFEHKFGSIDGVRTPCFFLKQGEGCSIYEDRPYSPCQTYKCEWLVNPDVPEEFKPNKVDVMVSKKGRSYFVATDAGDNPQDKVKLWWLEYVKSKKFNLSYSLNDELQFYGNERLRQTLGYSQKDLQPGEIPKQERDALKEQKKRNV
jgi:hypothetical protein